MPGGPQPRVLVRRGVDGLLVGWLAVIVWIAAWLAPKLGVAVPAGLVTCVYWVGITAAATHFGLSYHLAYRAGPAAVRRRPFALLWAPLALGALLTAVVAIALAGTASSVAAVARVLVTAVYALTTWHYVKQVYGVGRIGAAYSGAKVGRREADVLRYGLYPLWFLGAAQVLTTDGGYNLGGFRVGFAVLPAGSSVVLRWVALAAVVPIAVVFVRIALRRRALPPSLLVAPYAAAFLWLGVATNPILTLLLLAPFHALQYLAVGHRAELAVATGQPGAHGIVWWLNIFAGAACGGLLLSRWVPQFLDAHVQSGRLLFTAAFFVFLNLHHYVIDASIWRSKGELVQAMGRKPGSTDEPAPVTDARPAPQLVTG